MPTGLVLRGAELRKARELGLRHNSTRIKNIARERNRMAGVFKSFDLDGDGALSAAEFACALRRVNPELREAQVRELTQHVGKDEAGRIPWANLCDRLSASAEASQVYTPSFLKGRRWMDNGDIIGNTNDDARKGGAAPIDFSATAQERFPVPTRDTARSAGTGSRDIQTASNDQLRFDDWGSREQTRRRGRGAGVSSFQSSGLRFDDAGFQTNTVGRPSAAPTKRFSPTAQKGMQSSAMRECLQPETLAPRPSTAAASAGARSAERVLHLKSVRRAARQSSAGAFKIARPKPLTVGTPRAPRTVRRRPQRR